MAQTDSKQPGVMLPAFGIIESERVLALSELFAVVKDKFPVTEGHSLIIPRRAVSRFAELSAAEKSDLLELVEWTERYLEATLMPAPEGFNLGINDGPVAGQTIPQFHFHVIPRRKGDVTDSRGGVRCVVPDKAKYW